MQNFQLQKGKAKRPHACLYHKTDVLKPRNQTVSVKSAVVF